MEAGGGRDCRAVQEAALEILDMVRETPGESLRAHERPVGTDRSRCCYIGHFSQAFEGVFSTARRVNGCF